MVPEFRPLFKFPGLLLSSSMSTLALVLHRGAGSCQDLEKFLDWETTGPASDDVMWWLQSQIQRLSSSVLRLQWGLSTPCVRSESELLAQLGAPYAPTGRGTSTGIVSH